MRVAADVAAGEWVVEAVRDWGVVRSMVPDVFPAYARIFHPAYRHVDHDTEAGLSAPTRAVLIEATFRTRTIWNREVRWADVAEANGRVSHPAMEWASITGAYRFLWNDSQRGIWDEGPATGTLPLRHAARLSERLAEHTRTPGRCWFAIWEGFADLPGLLELDVPRLPMPHREMILLSGELPALPRTSFEEGRSDNPANWYRSPSLWWPDDRSWCVATDVDLNSTYIGASSDCVRMLVSDDELEVAEVSAGQGTTIDADSINPEPEGLPGR